MGIKDVDIFYDLMANEGVGNPKWNGLLALIVNVRGSSHLGFPLATYFLYSVFVVRVLSIWSAGRNGTSKCPFGFRNLPFQNDPEKVGIFFSLENCRKVSLLGIYIIGFFLGSGTVVSASSLSEVFKKVKESVVVIQTVQKNVVAGSTKGSVTMEGLGSGVLIFNSGMVLTAAHVVQNADEILVGFPNGESVPARVIGSEPAADVALLELAALPENPHPAMLADSDAAKIGDEVFVVGAPLVLCSPVIWRKP